MPTSLLINFLYKAPQHNLIVINSLEPDFILFLNNNRFVDIQKKISEYIYETDNYQSQSNYINYHDEYQIIDVLEAIIEEYQEYDEFWINLSDANLAMTYAAYKIKEEFPNIFIVYYDYYRNQICYQEEDELIREDVGDLVDTEGYLNSLGIEINSYGLSHIENLPVIEFIGENLANSIKIINSLSNIINNTKKQNEITIGGISENEFNKKFFDLMLAEEILADYKFSENKTEITINKKEHLNLIINDWFYSLIKHCISDIDIYDTKYNIKINILKKSLILNNRSLDIANNIFLTNQNKMFAIYTFNLKDSSVSQIDELINSLTIFCLESQTTGIICVYGNVGDGLRDKIQNNKLILIELTNLKKFQNELIKSVIEYG